MRPGPIGLVACFLLSMPHSIRAQSGIATREPNTTLIIRELPADQPGRMQTVRVFPRLSFSKSVLLVELVDPTDGSARFFQVSQTGVIHVFPHIPDPAPSQLTEFLDISGRVLDSGEQGLLGLAFDPDFFTSGEFYVYYSGRGTRRSVVSRFTAPNPHAGPADAASEEILLEVAQPFSNHNGGMIAFGPDGMLYVALGDGGSGGDPQNHGQRTTTLLGSILRLDVHAPPSPSSGLDYVIPPDNPFVDGGPEPGTRKEIYAYGFRNPYRFSFDRLTGFLYAADVGQNRWEEIDIVTAGGNYGWRIMEGNHCFNPSSCSASGLVLPIGEYSHSSNGGGASVTGGYVYYGSSVPELYGSYIFGDFTSGRVFSLRYDGETATPIQELASTSLTLTGFGQDATGEVYLLDYFGGIYVLRPQSPPVGSPFPTRLSDSPALLTAGAGQGHFIPGIFPYEPSAKLWSDGALKERYFALPDFDYAGPDFAQMTYQPTGGWDFPDDTVLVKNFLLPLDARDPRGSAKRIETRLLVKHRGAWHGFSYEWNDAETDAALLTARKTRTFTRVDATGQPFTYEWTYPSRTECRQCHTNAANHVLGLNTAQMNHAFTYPSSGVIDNQLRLYDELRLFDAPLPDAPNALPKMPDPADTSAGQHFRARAYLAANCAMCHQTGGTAGTSLDLRWELGNVELNAIGQTPSRGDLGIPGAEIVKAGDPNLSILFARMATLDAEHRMPPLASDLVDTASVALVRDWIVSLPAATDLQTALSASQTSYTTGDTLSVSLRLTSPGIASEADIFVGVLLANRRTILSFTDPSLTTASGVSSDLTTLVPMFPSMDLRSPLDWAPDPFLSYTWKGTEPTGAYTFFIAAVVPGGFDDGVADPGDVLSSKVVTVSLTR